MTVGLFRDVEDWARVRHGDGREMDVPKAQYLASRYKPEFEDLPLVDALDERRATVGRP